MRLLAAIALFAFAVGIGACTSSTDEPPAPSAPEAVGNAPAEPPAEASGASTETGASGDLVTASERAFEIAEKACRGCPQQKPCEDALVLALRITSAALQSVSSGSEELALRATQTDALAKRFDGLAELSEECDKKKPS